MRPEKIEAMLVYKNGESKIMDIFVKDNEKILDLHEEVRLSVPSQNILHTAPLLLLKHLTEDGDTFYLPLKVRRGLESDVFNLDSYTKHIHYMDYETAIALDLHGCHTVIDSFVFKRRGKDFLKELVEEFFKVEKEKNKAI